MVHLLPIGQSSCPEVVSLRFTSWYMVSPSFVFWFALYCYLSHNVSCSLNRGGSRRTTWNGRINWISYKIISSWQQMTAPFQSPLWVWRSSWCWCLKSQKTAGSWPSRLHDRLDQNKRSCFRHCVSGDTCCQDCKCDFHALSSAEEQRAVRWQGWSRSHPVVLEYYWTWRSLVRNKQNKKTNIDIATESIMLPIVNIFKITLSYPITWSQKEWK